MSANNRNRLKTTVSAVASSGLGAFTISTASSGYRSFVAGDDGLTFDGVLITEGTTWEVRDGCVYTHSGTSLSRGTLMDSSTGSAIAFTSAAVVSQGGTAGFATALAHQLDRAFTFIRSPSTGTQTVYSVTWNKISSILSDVVYNPRSEWDTTNKKFTPTRAGNYLVMVGAQLTGYVAVSSASIYKNGSAEAYGAVDGSAADTLPWVSTVVYCNGTTDYVEFYCYVSADKTTLEGTGRVLFKALYLGP